MQPRVHGVLSRLYMTSVSVDQRPARERAEQHSTAPLGWLAPEGINSAADND
ncbi:hypothetical protein ART_0314 [Arthrobacter sp. PAMC 25486]|nr:hypothetical protein ART_0314 [Arthrobacter sp. PAMC 25486]